MAAADSCADLCGVCKGEVVDSDRALCCDVCTIWFHIKCTKVTVQLYNAMVEAQKDDPDACPWYCPNCKQGAKSLRIQVIAIRRDQEEIKLELNKLSAQCTTNSAQISSINSNVNETNQKLANLQSSLDERLTRIEAGLSKPTTDLQNHDKSYLEAFKSGIEQKLVSANEKHAATLRAIEEKFTSVALNRPTVEPGPTPTFELNDTRKLRQCLSELEKIDQKKLNLVVANLPEQQSEEEDTQAFTRMIKEEFKLVVKVSKTTRLGKVTDNKDRLLKIELESLSDKKLILSRAKELRESTHDIYKRVYIRPDLTINQLIESKNLRASLKDRRLSQPGKHWVIKAGKVVELEATRQEQPQ